MARRIQTAVIGLLMMVNAATVNAQTPGAAISASAWDQALQRLDRQLELALELTSHALDASSVVTDLLARARRERDLAVHDWRAGNRLSAHNHLNIAFRLLDQLAGLTLKGPIHRLKQRLEELLRRAEEIVDPSGNEEAKRLLRAARHRGSRAEQALGHEMVKKAIELYRVAVSLCEQAIKMVEGERMGHPDSLEDAWQRFQQLYERAQEVTQARDAQSARRLLDRAARLARRSRNLQREGKVELAKDQYQKAMRLLVRIIDMGASGRAGKKQQAYDKVANLGELLVQATDQIASRPNDNAQLLVTRAIGLQNKALDALQQGRHNEAMRTAEIAAALAERALKLSKAKTGDWNARESQEIEQLTRTVDELKDSELSAEAQALTDAGEKLLESARQHHAQKRYQVAADEIWGTSRLLHKARGASINSRSRAASLESIKRRLQLLDQALEELGEGIEQADQKMLQDLVRRVRELQVRAEDALALDQLVLAETCTDIAMEYLKKLSRKAREQ